MEIVNFGHFTRYSGTDSGFLYFRNEDGLDWYELRAGLTTWDPPTGAFVNSVYGSWASVSSDGVVINVEYDPSRIVPDDRTVLGIDAPVSDVRKGMLYSGGVLSDPPPPTPDELRASFPELLPTTFWKTARQIGITKASITADIEKVEDEDDREDMLIEIDNCTAFYRLNRTVVAMALNNNIPPDQLDTLWLWAANTQV